MARYVMNDQVAAEREDEVQKELERLLSPVSDEDAVKAALQNIDLANEYLEKGTEAQVFSVPRRGDFAFAGNVFVPPPLARGFSDNDIVAVKIRFGRKGPVADRIAPLADYLSWHPEVIDLIRGAVEKRNRESAEFFGRRSPRRDWEGMKERVREVGFTLVGVTCVDRYRNYGGAGVDTYLVKEPLTKEDVERILDAMHGRHAEPDNGLPVEHGWDRITVFEGGFENSWHGPYTD